MPRRIFKDFGHWFISTDHAQYAFAPVSADEIRGGTKADVEGKYVYVGDTMMNNYPAEQPLDGVDDDLLDELLNRTTLVRNIDSGWASWDGRPEFSTSFVDISEMEVVEP